MRNRKSIHLCRLSTYFLHERASAVADSTVSAAVRRQTTRGLPHVLHEALKLYKEQLWTAWLWRSGARAVDAVIWPAAVWTTAALYCSLLCAPLAAHRGSPYSRGVS
jgi:hypothetical protein